MLQDPLSSLVLYWSAQRLSNTDGIIYGDMFLTRISTTTGGVRQSVGEAAAERGGQT
jgi:hypothetical protein